MTEYDYSPEAYDRYIATQHRIANWVDKTEQHRAEFQSDAAGGLQDLSRSGPVSHSKLKRSSPSHPHPHHSGQSQPRQFAMYPPHPNSDSSDSYYEGPWPGPMPQRNPPMMLPQQPAQFHPMQLPPPPPMMMPPTFMTSPHRVSHHHRHRSHDHRRSRSQHSPPYYTVSPHLSPGYQYPTVMSGGHQGYVMMPQYGATQAPLMVSSFSQPPYSVPPNATLSVPPTNYIQPQLSTSAATQSGIAFLATNSQPQSYSSQQGMAWSTYVAPSPAYSKVSTPSGTPQPTPYIMGIPAYQPFVQPTQPSYLIPPTAHQRVYDISKYGEKQYFRRSIG